MKKNTVKLKVADFFPRLDIEKCNKNIESYFNILGKHFYPGFEEIMHGSLELYMHLNGKVEMTIERKRGFLRSERRRYTMTLSIGNKTSAQPAYVIIDGKEQTNQDNAIEQIGISLLLPDILMSTVNKEKGHLELNDLIINSLDNAFIANYLMVNTRQSSDKFSTSDDDTVNFTSIDQENVLLIFHRIDLKKVRFFFKGGKTQVVSYRHMMQSDRQPLLDMIETWKTEGKRCMEYIDQHC